MDLVPLDVVHRVIHRLGLLNQNLSLLGAIVGLQVGVSLVVAQLFLRLYLADVERLIVHLSSLLPGCLILPHRVKHQQRIQIQRSLRVVPHLIQRTRVRHITQIGLPIG